MSSRFTPKTEDNNKQRGYVLRRVLIRDAELWSHKDNGNECFVGL